MNIADLTRRHRLSAGALAVLAVVATTAAAVGLWAAVDAARLAVGIRHALADPGGVVLALGGFAAAFVLRALAWVRIMPDLSLGQALAGIHVALGANHVLPFRLGEPLRVVSAVRRGGADPADAAASTVALRTADILSLLLLGGMAAPVLMARLLGRAGAAVTGAVLLIGLLAVRMLVRRRRRRGSTLGVPGPLVLILTTLAWVAEAVLVWQVLRWFDAPLSAADVMVVLAAAVGAQLVAIAPGGLGTYEAAATAALVAVGIPAATGAAAAVTLHALKTAYSLAAGAVSSMRPAPSLWGRLRLPRHPPTRQALQRRDGHAVDGPVVLFLPALDEGPRIGGVIRRVPPQVHGRRVQVLVVDDGSTDQTVRSARRAGARVVSHDHNRGLGAAVRTGLAAAVAMRPSAVAFCDADGEYDPAQLAELVGPILAGEADYVVGSRFRGRIGHMRPHRRVGNRILTAWVRWTVRRPVSDGQSGYRAFSPAAARAATVPHDYNYAQVLTIDLVSRGFVYHEVGIDYRFRRSGESFVTLGRYLRRVVPAVWRQLNPPHRVAS